jgi:hypothetical protein
MTISATGMSVLVIAGALVSCSSSPGSESSSSGGSGADGGGTMTDGVPAGDPAAVNAWLQKKEYQAWPKESAARAFTPGAGGHSGTVRAYLNPKLDASMTAGNAEHPIGAAAVKEFFQGDTLTGWAAYVKTQDKSDGGKGWYWYETFGVTPGASSIGGQGSGTCTGCHSSGRDFVRVTHPLK